MQTWAENSNQESNADLKQMQRIVNSLLVRRDYSAFEIKQKLLQKEFAESAIDAFIAQLEELKLLDDTRFTAAFVKAKYQQGKGTNWIIQALKQKGIRESKTLMALSELIEPEDWQTKILHLLEFRKLDLTDIKQKAKAYRFLLARGFTSSQINSALKHKLDNVD